MKRHRHPHRRSDRASRARIEAFEPRLLMAVDPVISEFMASNDHTLADSDGDYSDWVEIHNSNTTSLDLSGYYLTASHDNLTKWRFPTTTTVSADGYLVVFASNKNRAVAGQELHTNFKLEAAGEYLGLVKPDGTTVVSEYAPAYPPQQQDVSYGIPTVGLNTVPLVAAGAPGKVTVPLDGTPGNAWTQPGFNDASWTAGTSGAGYEVGAALTLPGEVESNDTPALANSTAGNFGVYSGNLYQLLIRTSAGSSMDYFNIGAMQLGDVISLTASGSAGSRGPSNNPDVDIYRYNNGSPVAVATDLDSGPGNDAVINRFTVSVPDTYYVAGRGTNSGAYEIGLTLENAGAAPNTGSGLITETESNNSVGEADNAASSWRAVQYRSATTGAIANGNDYDYYKFTLLAGDTVSFVVDAADNASPQLDAQLVLYNANGTIVGKDDGSSVVAGPYLNDAWVYSYTVPTSGSYFARIGTADGAAISPASYTFNVYLSTNTPPSNAPVFGELIGTNVQAAMQGVNATAYVRMPFTYDASTPVDAMTLAMKYDDGFVAYLNGTEIARRNAGGTAGTPLAYNANATASRSGAQATTYELIDVTAFKNLLAPGAGNVLAVQGLNVSAGDNDFLILPELRASKQFQQPTAYFTVPTPRAANGSVGLNPGPSIGAVSRPPNGIADNENLVVTATVSPRSAPISSVTLKYVVMQGAEVPVQMFDDGAHGDEAAGDGVYGATIPASASSPNQMVRYYVTAADTAGLTSRAPVHAISDSAVYYGTVVRDPSLTSTLPILQLFAADTGNITTRTGTRVAVYYNGDFYDNVFARDRGGNTSDGIKLDFNQDDRFRRTPDALPVDEINLNYRTGDATAMRSILSFDVFNDAGQVALDAFSTRVQLNGAFWKEAVYIENVDAQMLDSRGLDGDGAIYKLVSDQPQMTNAGAYEKKTRRDESNADLQAFLNGIHQGGQAAINYLYDNFDLDGFFNYWAVNILTGDTDDIQKNYYLYRDTNGDGRWQIMPWDKDLTFGLNYGIAENQAHDPQTHPLLGDHNHPKIDGPGAYNFLIDLILTNPTLKQAYLRRLRSVMDEFLQPASTPVAQRYFETKVDQLAAQLSADPQVLGYLGGAASLQNGVNAIKTYLTNRRQHLFVDHSTNTAYPDFAGIPASQDAHPAINIGAIDYSPASSQQSQEYIRLDNPNAFAVDISGWKLASAVDFTFAPGTTIPAGESLYVAANVKAFLSRTTGPHGGQGLHVVGGYDGQLSARGETIELRDGASAVVNTLTYTGNPTPAQLGLRVTEVMFHPSDQPGSPAVDDDDLEYLELENISAAPLDLSGIKFTQGFDFTFPAGSTLAAGAYGVLVRNRAAFEVRYGVGTVDILGQYAPDVLDNGGERVRIEDATGEVVLDFNYAQDWYPGTDGGGYSLVIRDPLADVGTWGDKAAWRPSGARSGSPGVVDVPDTTSPSVVSMSFDVDHAPNSVSVKFSEDVSQSLVGQSPISVVLRKADGTSVAVSFQPAGYDFNSNTLSFSPTAAGAPGSPNLVLPDGNYRATLLPDVITDVAGNALVVPAGSGSVDFFVFAGDADHDRIVGPSDFNLLATNFGKGNRTRATGDFDGDGIVGPSDFNLLATNFGKTLPAPPAGLVTVQPTFPAAIITTSPSVTTGTASTSRSSKATSPLGTKTVIRLTPPLRSSAKSTPLKRMTADVLRGG